MPAFNFRDQYIDKILDGTKRSTIRKTLRAKVGDTAYLFARGRSKNCLLVSVQKISQVRTFHIPLPVCNPLLFVGGTPVRLDTECARDIAKMDGFSSPIKMVEFFDKTYGLPFSGFLYEFENPGEASDSMIRTRWLAWRVEDRHSNWHHHFPTMAMAEWHGKNHFRKWDLTPEAVSRGFIRQLYFGPMDYCGVPAGLIKEKFKLLPKPRLKK